MKSSPHLRGIVIAGVLAAVALGLGFVTLAMNQSTSHASTNVVLPLKDRHQPKPTVKAAALKTQPKAEPKAKPKPAKPKVDPNFAAARAAGLPVVVARALAGSPVVVVQLTSAADPVAQIAADEAKSGAKLAGAAYVEISIDRDGGPVQTLTRLLGTLPDAPASLVYTRPGTASTTLTGFNDRTVVEQAVADAFASLPPKPVTTTATVPSGVTAA